MKTKDILKKIRKIEISTKDIVSDLFSGEYHSIFKGQGLEFSEVRQYQDGDSFRQIDWNVSAKMDYPYIKKFEETRELNIIFLVDGSASTLFGTVSNLKSEYIAELTAVLAFSALSNNDKVGLMLFCQGVEKYIPAKKGRKTILRILSEILQFSPKEKTTNIGEAIKYLMQVTKKRSVIFIVSDFLDDGYIKPLSVLSQKHDVIALRVLDKTERELPVAGIMEFVDPENGQTFTVNSFNKKKRQQFAQKVQELDEQTQQTFKKIKVDLLTLYTQNSYIKELMKFFKQRMKRK